MTSIPTDLPAKLALLLYRDNIVNYAAKKYLKKDA